MGEELASALHTDTCSRKCQEKSLKRHSLGNYSTLLNTASAVLYIA